MKHYPLYPHLNLSSFRQRASSTKNTEKKLDPEIHQTKRKNQWHFSMKCHTGVDAGSGFVHTVEATPANVHDVTVAAKLLREDDQVVYGDSANLYMLAKAGGSLHPAKDFCAL